MQIRRAIPGDAPAIASVLYEAFAEYEPLYTPEGFSATTPPSDRIGERIGEGPAWVTLQDDGVVGTVAAVCKGEGLYVRSMAIVPSARGQGIGEALLKVVEGYARDAGATYMFLS